MNIAFDLGGVISKDPRWKSLINILQHTGDVKVYIITDMHNKEEVIKILKDNQVNIDTYCNMYCADYNKYGEMCKAILCRELKIDFIFDDFAGYLQWDSQLGEPPIRLLVQPDWTKPYWHTSWKCEGSEFGRQVAPHKLMEKTYSERICQDCR